MQLLHRTSRVVTLTGAGRALATEARRVLAGFEMALAEARRAGGARPVLRIGCVPYLPIERVHRFFAALEERLPDSDGEVTHLPAVEQLRLLGRWELDLAIFHRAGDPDGVDLQPLFPGERLVAFLAKDHRLATQRVVGIDDLAREVHLTWSRSVNPPLYDRLMALIADAGYRFRDTVQLGGANSRDLMLAIAASGGVGLGVPAFKPEPEGPAIVIHRPLDPPIHMPDSVVAWRTEVPRHLRAAVIAVREAARELYRAAAREDPAGLERVGDPVAGAARVF